MKNITKIEGQGIPLGMKDVDTDLLIPAQYLTSVSAEGYGKHLFQRLRDQDSEFVLNKEQYKKGNILIAGDNFGCGSSREHAVWALTDYGIEAVIAPSFADIFANNSAKNGLVLITFEQDVVDELMDAAGQQSLNITIDIEAQLLTSNSGLSQGFELDPFSRYCFLQGLDELDYLVQHKADIENYWQQRQAFLGY